MVTTLSPNFKHTDTYNIYNVCANYITKKFIKSEKK